MTQQNRNGRYRWEKFWYDDWMADPNLQRAGLEAQGAWMRVLCTMWHDGVPEITESLEFWAKILGVSQASTERLLKLVLDKKAGEGKMVDGSVTLISRRLLREFNNRQSRRLRQQRWRENKSVDGSVDALVDGQIDGEKLRSLEARATPLPPLSKSQPQTPYQEIINLYHKTLPDNPPVKERTDELDKELKCRWAKHPDMAWWTDHFKRVSNSAFLTGKIKDWAASLFWLCGPKNMTRVLNGEFDPREAAGGDDLPDY